MKNKESSPYIFTNYFENTLVSFQKGRQLTQTRNYLTTSQMIRDQH